MVVLSPALLVATANAFVGLGEVGGDNRGAVVELFLREVGQLPGQPWCAAFVHHVGYCAHYDHSLRKSSWPLPSTASCYELGEFARAKGILAKDAAIGDVFLSYSKELKRFHHTGIVVSIDTSYRLPNDGWLYRCTTIEGNTNDDGSPNGNMTLRKIRHFNSYDGDRFVRWAALEVARVAA